MSPEPFVSRAKALPAKRSKKGYRYKNVSAHINKFSPSLQGPCELHPCKNGGTCYPVNGKYDFKCACVAAFRGKRCDKSKYKGWGGGGGGGWYILQ